VTDDDATLDEITARWVDDQRTQELSPRATLAPRPSSDDRSRRALALLELRRPLDHESLQVGERIGEGGMSIVRRGVQVALGREVAVKTARTDVEDELGTLRLLREAWVTGALEHPNVVPVHDITVDRDGAPQIILKRIAGKAWSSAMHDETAIRERSAAGDALEWNLRILMQVSNAVHFAHTRGMIHRDLKSDNVMIGEFGEVYVLDWGLAVATKDDGTGRFPLVAEIDTIAGSPAYMAPEMLEVRADRISARTDVYLLGAILFEILTGSPPHMAPTMREVAQSVLRSKPVFPEHAAPELAAIARRALERRPEDRFESADALRAALSAFLEQRASTRLASDAMTKLHELELACVEGRDRSRSADERGGLRYHLYGECRFAFREALRMWPGNEVAQRGMVRAATVMAELELWQGDARSAELVLLELGSPPEDLLRRVKTARRAKDIEQNRLASLVRDHDPRIGRSVRLMIGLTLGGVWTVLPWIGFFLEKDDPRADQFPPLVSSAMSLLFAAALARVARTSLARTRLNRNLVRTVGVVLSAQIAIYAITWRLHVSYVHTRVLVLLLYASCCALTAAVVERRLWPAAAAYAMVVLLATKWPTLAWPFESFANVVLTLVVFLMWRRPAAG